jgi:hypothetical protein
MPMRPKQYTLFCPACGEPALLYEAMTRALAYAYVDGKKKCLVVEWGDASVRPPTTDDHALVCVECGEWVESADELDIPVAHEHGAALWHRHPCWTPEGWVGDFDTVRSILDYTEEADRC